MSVDGRELQAEQVVPRMARPCPAVLGSHAEVQKELEGEP